MRLSETRPGGSIADTEREDKVPTRFGTPKPAKVVDGRSTTPTTVSTPTTTE